MSAHAGQRGPGLWDEVCSPKMQRWTLLALADLFVINRPHTPYSPSKPCRVNPPDRGMRRGGRPADLRMQARHRSGAVLSAGRAVLAGSR